MVSDAGSITAVASKDPTSQERCVDDTVTIDFEGGTADGNGSDDGDVREGVIVRTDPETATLAPNETVTVDVVVVDADGGVGAGNVSVRVTDPSVTELTAVSVLGDPGIEEATVVDGGDAARAEFALRDGNESGPVRVLRLRLRGNAAGSTTLSLAAPSLGDERGNSYVVAATSDGNVTVARDAGADGTTATGTGGTGGGTDPGAGDATRESGDGQPGGTTSATGPGFGTVVTLTALLALGIGLAGRDS